MVTKTNNKNKPFEVVDGYEFQLEKAKVYNNHKHYWKCCENKAVSRDA